MNPTKLHPCWIFSPEAYSYRSIPHAHNENVNKALRRQTITIKRGSKYFKLFSNRAKSNGTKNRRRRLLLSAPPHGENDFLAF